MKDKIEKWMTELPHTIGKDAKIDKARTMMREYRCHHLPVLEAGHLVGMISDRDAQVATSFTDQKTTSVGELMTEDPIVVDRTDPVANVLKLMLERQVGSVIVSAKPGKPWGIFTSTDALKMLVKVIS